MSFPVKLSLIYPSIDDKIFLIKSLFGLTTYSDFSDETIPNIINIGTMKINLELFIDGIHCLTFWDFSTENHLSLGLYPAKVKFCAVNLLETVGKRIWSIQ